MNKKNERGRSYEGIQPHDESGKLGEHKKKPPYIGGENRAKPGKRRSYYTGSAADVKGGSDSRVNLPPGHSSG